MPASVTFGQNKGIPGVGCCSVTMQSRNWPMCCSSFLQKNVIPVINHLPYLPDLASADIFSFPKIKLQMKGQFFEDVPTIQCTVTMELMIPAAGYAYSFDSLYDHFTTYITGETMLRIKYVYIHIETVHFVDMKLRPWDNIRINLSQNKPNQRSLRIKFEFLEIFEI